MAAFPAIRRPEVALPDIALPDIDRPRISLEDAIAKIELPAQDVPDVNIAQSIGAAAEAIGFRRSPRRARWPLAVGGLVLVGTVWGLVNSPRLRTRLRELANATREGIASWRRSAFGQATAEESDPVAFTAAHTKPIPAERWSDSEDGTPDYPDGLGSDAQPSPEDSAIGV
jgi:hypothetical protein